MPSLYSREEYLSLTRSLLKTRWSQYHADYGREERDFWNDWLVIVQSTPSLEPAEPVKRTNEPLMETWMATHDGLLHATRLLPVSIDSPREMDGSPIWELHPVHREHLHELARDLWFWYMSKAAHYRLILAPFPANRDQNPQHLHQCVETALAMEKKHPGYHFNPLDEVEEANAF